MNNERESRHTDDLVIGILGAALFAVGTVVGIQSVKEYREVRSECISSLQIDEQGNKLEGFVVGKGCERFLQGRAINYSFNW